MLLRRINAFITEIYANVDNGIIVKL